MDNKMLGNVAEMLKPLNRMRLAGWVLLISALFLAAGACGGSTEGEPAPSFSFPAFGNENYEAGEEISLERFADRMVVVNFWYPSCAPCREEMPDMEEASHKYREDGVTFVGIQLTDVDPAEEGQKFINELGITYAIGADPDGDIFKRYEVISFPTTFFLDRSHNVVRKFGGFLSADALEDQIQDMIAADKSS